MRKTMGQERAKYAWEECIEKAKDGKPHVPQDYVSLARSFPVMVLTNGLGQALAFLLSKESRPHQMLANQLALWLCGTHPVPGLPIYPIGGQGDGSQLMRAIYNGDSTTLRRATAETLALSEWIKRFAEAEKEPDV